MRLEYSAPRIHSEKSYETNALSCAKTTDPPPGSRHFGSAYDTFTGHFAGYLGTMQSQSGATGIGFGPGGTSSSYHYSGLCPNWITFSS